jgi:formate/nitrite transporter FocA (FNT family)
VNRYALIAPLAAFGIAGVGLYLYFIQAEAGSTFTDNLVPELIGFCLEGFFLVGLLSFIQQTREHDRRQQLWLSLPAS